MVPKVLTLAKRITTFEFKIKTKQILNPPPARDLLGNICFVRSMLCEHACLVERKKHMYKHFGN